MSAEKALHVIALTAENVKRIKAVRIRPDGQTVVISGRNEQGKSSLLDAIEMALGGKKSIPAAPIRDGARRARIVVDLGEIVVERTFSQKGTELTVRGADGAEKASPQKLLDSLIAKETFDPIAFTRMEPPKQDELLRRVLGLDFSDIEAKRAKAYAARTDANREIKRLETLFDEKTDHSNVPAEPVNAAELAAELQRLEKANGARALAQREITTARGRLEKHDQEISSLRRQLEELTEAIAAAETSRETMLAEILESEKYLPPEESTTDVEEKLRKCEETNAKVRANKERKALYAQMVEATKGADALTDEIDRLDTEKAERLAAAKFPIAGLGFDEFGPTLDGVPLSQACQSKKLRVGVAIAAAQNPRIKIMLVREGAFLDRESMTLLGELVANEGYQAFIERVDDAAPGAVIIEDGEVVEAAGDATAAE